MQTELRTLRGSSTLPSSDEPPILSLERHHSSERWDAVSDLDKFFTSIYNYYLGKGFRAIVLLRAIDLLSLIFTTVFTTFLLLFVDWSTLLSCTTEKDVCAEVVHFPDDFGLYELASVLFASVYGVYSLWYFYYFLQTIQEMNDTSHIFNEKLGISDHELPYISWDSVVKILIEKQQKYRFCIVKTDLTALDISNRIMRKDNYLIGLVLNGVVVPSVWLPFSGVQARFTKHTEFVLRFALIENMLSSRTFTLDRSMKTRPDSLRWRFRTCGVIYCFVMIPLFIFTIMKAFFKHNQNLETTLQPAKRKSWSNLYRWNFREFNELPHFFEDRVNALSKHTDLFLESFRAPLLSEIFARGVSYICGSLLAVMLAVAFYDDKLPFNVRIAGLNLVSYMLLFGGAVACCRLFTRADDLNYELKQPQDHMVDMKTHAHQLPHTWYLNPHSREVRDVVMREFKHRALETLDEVISVLWTPYYLFSFLPRQAPRLCQFLTEYTSNEEGVGDIVVYSSFKSEELATKLSETESEKLRYSCRSFRLNMKTDESFDDSQPQEKYQKLRGESVLQE